MKTLFSIKHQVILLSFVMLVVIGGAFVATNNYSSNRTAVVPKMSSASQEERTEKATSRQPAKVSQSDADELLPSSAFGTKVQSLDEAVAKLSVRPKLPNTAVAGEPMEVYVLDAPTPDKKGLEIVYENGIHITIHPNASAPNYEAIKAEIPDFIDIDINGIKGLSDEPETKELKVKGKVQEPGVVTWFENGIDYAVYGDEAGTIGLKKLIPIAKSMR